MELINKTDLGRQRDKFISKQSFNALNKALNESRERKSSTGEITVFLSHKHEDVKEFENAVALLKSLGVSIYIDTVDEEMPKNTSGATALLLKKKIKENRKFILLATEKAIASKWCNWELGFGDANKYIDHIALLVVKDDYGNWTGTEYLQIYPVIGKTYSWSDDYFEVEFPNGRKVDLKEWLRS